MDAPHVWLDGLVAALNRALPGRRLHALSTGPMWLHARFDESQLFVFSQAQLRLAWLDAERMPRERWKLLDHHDRSPFRSHLRDRECRSVQLLVDGEGRREGLAIELQGLWLCVRWHPRPGAIWLEGEDGELLAQQGNMDGSSLVRAEADLVEFDADAHARQCRDAFEAQLATTVRQRMERERRERDKRARRLQLKLEAELTKARRELGSRAAADALAARLHEWKQLPQELELEDFEGQVHHLQFDPKLAPSRNLDLLYRRCAKAERSVQRIEARMAELEAETGGKELPELEPLGIDQLMVQAAAEGIDLAPAPRSVGERRDSAEQERLPYRTLVLRSGRELRIGRSARDNDEMLRHHSHGTDLWLHAQGVQGSHVLIRHSTKAPSPLDVEIAARVAAHYSKARTSSLVPVVVTERRYVRKPRKSPPGTVVAERTRTLFVKPGLPGEDDEISR